MTAARHQPPSPPLEGWLAAYDVSAGARRLRLAKRLEAHGHRTQYSVYRLDDIDARATSGLVQAWSSLLDPASDSLLLLPWCTACRRAAMGVPLAPTAWRIV